MRKVLGLLALLGAAFPLGAQAANVQLLPGGCGTAAPTSGGDLIYIDTTGNVCTGGLGGPVNLAAAAIGGATGGTILSAASDNATSVKASPGTLASVTWLQTTTTLMDVRFYDTASTPTCSSATGMKLNFVVQSNAVTPGATFNFGPFGIAFTSGIGVCITGANANNDDTSAVLGLNLIYGYK
jgi:hypothetical protein